MNQYFEKKSEVTAFQIDCDEFSFENEYFVRGDWIVVKNGKGKRVSKEDFEKKYTNKKIVNNVTTIVAPQPIYHFPERIVYKERNWWETPNYYSTLGGLSMGATANNTLLSIQGECN